MIWQFKGCRQRLQVTVLQVTAVAAGYWVGRPSSGRRCSARTTDNLDLVYEVVLHKNG